MWSLEVIEYLNQQAAKKARQLSATPFVPSGPEAVESWPPFPFPNLGDDDPPGSERTDRGHR
jgi:hypothetical protein